MRRHQPLIYGDETTCELAIGRREPRKHCYEARARCGIDAPPLPNRHFSPCARRGVLRRCGRSNFLQCAEFALNCRDIDRQVIQRPNLIIELAIECVVSALLTVDAQIDVPA